MFVFAGAGGQFQLWPVPAASQWSGGQVPRRGEKTGRVSLPGQPGSPRGGYWESSEENCDVDFLYDGTGRLPGARSRQALFYPGI